MYRLAVSTSTKTTSFCIMRDSNVLIEKNIYLKQIDHIIKIVDELLVSQELILGQIDEFVVVAGPGSYAGIRMSTSVIKSFALVNNKPVKIVNSVELFAYQFRVFKGLIFVAMDSRKNEINYGVYGGNPFNIVLEFDTISIPLFLEKLSKIDGPYLVVGDMKIVPDQIKDIYIASWPRASEAILLSMNKEIVPVDEVAPVYSYPVSITSSNKVGKKAKRRKDKL